MHRKDKVAGHKFSAADCPGLKVQSLQAFIYIDGFGLTQYHTEFRGEFWMVLRCLVVMSSLIYTISPVTYPITRVDHCHTPFVVLFIPLGHCDYCSQ